MIVPVLCGDLIYSGAKILRNVIMLTLYGPPSHFYKNQIRVIHITTLSLHSTSTFLNFTNLVER